MAVPENELDVLRRCLEEERQKNNRLQQQLQQTTEELEKSETSLNYYRRMSNNEHASFPTHVDSSEDEYCKKYSSSNKAKEKIFLDLERQEECMTNKLQRQLSQMKHEKVRTHGEVLELKQQLHHMVRERERMARMSEEEEEYLSISFLKKIRQVSHEKTELELQLSRTTRSNRSESFDQSCDSSVADSNMTPSILSADDI